MKIAPPEVFKDLEQQLDDVDVSGKSLSHITPEFTDKKSRDFTFKDSEDIMKQKRKKWQETKIHQIKGSVIIPTDYPIMISGIGDVHWGSLYTDNDRFRRDIDYILSTEGVYVVLMSNLIDNAIPSQYPDSMLVAGLNPEEQIASMRSIVRELDEAGKVLATVESPCHEGWTWKRAGQDVNRLLFEGMSFPILENGGILDLKLGTHLLKRLYQIALYHQSGPYESNFNKTHALKQLNRLQRQVDIIFGAHKHYSTIEHEYRLREPQLTDSVYIRTGTYKLNDRWATKRGYSGGEPSGESVILYPDKRRMIPILDIEVAVDVYRAIIMDYLINES
jgi:hypothetical protein